MLESNAYEKIHENYLQKTTATSTKVRIQNSFVVYKIYKKYRNRFTKVKSPAKKNYFNRNFNEAKGNIRATCT